MAVITPEQAGHPHVPLFLDLIAWSEGTEHSPLTKNHGYDVLVSGVHGPAIFTDFSKHPNILVQVNHAGLESTAAGRYQELHRNWVSMQPELHLPDFGPLSQDKMAVQHLKECGALAQILMGRIEAAITKASGIWASFPGNTYGQGPHSMATIMGVWNKLTGGAS